MREVLICRDCSSKFQKGVDIQHYNAIATNGICENCNPLFNLAENEEPNIYEK